MSAGKRYTIHQTKSLTDYTSRNKSTAPFYHERGQTATTGRFTRRIGSTTYRVSVHFSQTSKETMDEKIMRVIKNEASGKAAGI